MAEPRIIFCPRCHRKVTSYDGKQTSNPMAKCRKCGKLVVYNIEKDEVMIKDVPQREQASGVRFY